MLVASELGNSPWVVLSEGVEAQTPLSVGVATVVVSFLVLLMWIPLRQRPGLGTIANAIVIGVAIDASLLWLPDTSDLAARYALVFGGIALVGAGSGLYLTCFLGPGPRDGLMTGISRRTGLSLRVVRTGIEVAALTGGWFLGGTVGVGTLAFALLIGPAVQASVMALAGRPLDEL
ncbi:MAG TPA: hypothetical protein VD790_11270 [Thermoleophilaceae bacterium]|nr:hypothetical protein [Thermoleophilaceae bacterium]